jgi:photosystem II stability/assembly factor-like uncharacterized protein
VAVDSSGYIYISNLLGFTNYGGVYRSTDGGESWHLKGYSNSNLLSIAVHPANNTIFTGGTGKIYKSIDQGNSWSTAFSFFASNVIRIICSSDSLIFAAAEEALIRSADNGNTWKIVLADSSINYQEVFADVAFSPDGFIYACSKSLYGGCGRVYRSADLGNTWQIFGLCNHFFSLAIDNSGNIYVGGEGLFRYDYINQVWEQLLPGGYAPYDILITPDNVIYIACTAENGAGLGGIYFSHNGGQTFTKINSGLNYPNMRRITLDNAGRLLSNNNDVFRSFDTIVTNIDEFSINERISLKYFPNPFSNSINIIIENPISGNGDFVLKVYDSFGKLVFDTPMITGVPFKWEPYNLNPGLYYILAYNSKQRYTTKIIKTQ